MRRWQKSLIWIALALIAAPAHAGWGARNKRPAPKRHKTWGAQRNKTKKKPKRSPTGATARKGPTSAGKTNAGKTSAGKTSAAQTLSLSQQVHNLLSGRWRPAQAVKLLRLSVTRHEMKAAERLAEALLARRSVKPKILAEAATALGSDQRHPLQLKLWRRVSRSGRVPKWMRGMYFEGYFDALLAQGRPDKAHKLLTQALRKTPPGRARALWERLVAWGQSTGQMSQVRQRLKRANDPDAAILAAKLADSDGDELAGVTLLQRAFRRFPGHRALQKTLMDELARRGMRAELSKVIARVVTLNPRDATPWLTYIDAAIVARDTRGARKKIDALLKRYPRDDVLIEALIDREQTLGDDRRRVARMFTALLKASPREPSYREAYAEWLFGGSQAERKQAMKVLEALVTISRDRYSGMRRVAALLSAQELHAEADKMYRQMLREFPQRVETYRGLAQLQARQKQTAEAEQTWLRLVQLRGDEPPPRRQLATQARQGISELYRGAGVTEQRARGLWRRVKQGESNFGELLLLLTLNESLDFSLLSRGWQTGVDQRLAKVAKGDAEYLSAWAKVALRRGDLPEAMAIAERLDGCDAVSGRRLRVEVIERLLRRGEGAKSAELEEVLLRDNALSARQVLRLAELHLREGDRQRAVALIRRAAERDPTSTTPVLRLASIFRQRGQRAKETVALQRVITRSVDTDEIERAGQRLLTLAMMQGDAASLLRWIHQVSLNHARRSVIDRFRLLAYDVWLRSARLSKALKQKSDNPPQTHLTEALNSDDLALRVRALKQLIRSRRGLSVHEGRKLLADSSLTIRSLAIAALADSDSEPAADLIATQPRSGSWRYRQGTMLALAQLPHTAAAQGVLMSGLNERASGLASVAALALGRVGDAEALSRLRRLSGRRARLNQSIALALGPLLRRANKRTHQALELLKTWARELNARDSVRLSAAALWGLAASGHGRQALLRAAAESPNAIHRLMALRLLASAQPPTLPRQIFRRRFAPRSQHRGHQALIDAVLAPWLVPIESSDQEKISLLRGILIKQLKASAPDIAAKWCSQMSDSLESTPSLQRWCGALISQVRSE